ncbi:MAG TPA: hypothetical protein VN759_01815 [Pseudolysinimonas sp.]|nr:hypothetical protein [Pseudolysinimonas sp.]
MLFAGSRLSLLGAVAIVAGIVAVALVGIVKDRSGSRPTVRGLMTAVGAGCGFGGLVLAYSATSPADGVAPLVVARVVQSAAMWAGVIVVSRRARVAGNPSPEALPRTRRLWLLLAVGGTLDATANVLIQAALHSGAPAAVLPVVSVLNALYPIGTVVLAAIVLRERQTVGLVIALASSAVLATQ